MKNKKGRQGFIRTTLEIGIIILLVFAAFNIINSIYVNPGDGISYQIDSPLETYTFNEPYNVSQIIIASTYIVFNDTGFNITSTNAINIQINHIDEDIGNPADDDDLLLSFKVTNSPGATWFNISGFESASRYILEVNDVFSSNYVANSTGCISFYDTPTLNDVYNIFPGDTPPSIIINFAGNLSNSGGPYYLPPAESPPHAEDGYYTNDSRQSEGWIYVNVTASDTHGVNYVWLNWLNETTWTNYTYEFTNRTGGYFDINTSNNFSTAEGYNYSFNIVANDTLGNSKNVWWNKTAIRNGIIARRTVQLNCTPASISYTPYYLFNAPSYTGIPGDALKHDRLHHDQGPDGTHTDTGILTDDVPTDTMNLRHCGAYVGYWFDESVCAEQFTLNNIYYHLWWSSDETGNNINWTGYNKQRTYLNQATIEYYSPKIADSPSTITYDNSRPLTSNDYYLNAHLQTLISPVDFTDNDIYELVIKVTSVFPETVHPSVISNRSIIGFILLNVPSNTTLNTSHADTDSDSLSDWNELYVTYTNPFLNDTDNDGVNDYDEYMSGSDPNDYTDTTAFSNSPPSFSTPTPTNNSVEQLVSLNWQITITDSDSDLFNWTIECNNSQTDSGNDESDGAKQLSFSGNINTKYTVWVNATDGNDNSGNWTNHTYYFTTHTGNPAVISSPSPSNGSIDVSVSLASVSITIEDPEGINFDWYITTSPNVGSNSGAGASNGSKTCSISGLSYEATYTWYVKVWDTMHWTNRSYHFTIEEDPGGGPPPNTAPSVSNPYPVDGSTLQVITPYCHVYVVDADSDPMTINFYNSTDGVSWTWQQTNSSVATGTTVYWNYTQANNYNTIYYWKVTADDAVINISKTYSFTTYPDNPVITSYSPLNGAVDVILNTTLSVTIFDYQGDNMNVTFRTNASGIWQTIGSNLSIPGGSSIGNGTYSCDNTSVINKYDTKYWWSVNITGSWTNATYSFTTESSIAPVISDPIPRDDKQRISTYISNLSVVITDVNSNFNYTIETDPNVGSISENDVGDGVKTCVVSGLDYSTTYTWYVNATDGESWTNTSYSFTTKLSTEFDIEDFKLNLPEWAMGSYKVYVGDFVWMFLFVGVIAITWGSSKHISSVFIVILLTFAAYGTQRVFVDNSEVSLLFSVIAAVCVAAIMLGLFLKKRYG